jgi:murein DD-endopeptidase MepM/ murein hydrolase activator NlpD
MRRLLVLAALLLAAPAAGGAIVLPGADAPNTPGSIVLAPFWTSPPARAETISNEDLLQLWRDAGSAYGIPWQVLAAVNKIESDFGRNMGPSSAGAIGWMQFLPSTWTSWGVDADGNGFADPWSPRDAVYAAARYLAASGGQTDIAGALFSYNHAGWYVNEVLQLAQYYGLGGDAGSVVFDLDSLDTGLQRASGELQAANEAYGPATERVRAIQRRVRALERRALAAPLLSDRLLLQKQAVLLAVRLDDARAQAAAIRHAIDRSQKQLDSLRQQASAAAFAPAAAQALGTPIAAGDYVFPVGGGPDVVSVSHTHHDYPAADIAAPQGSPVYALTDSVVLYSWSQPDVRCGVGFTIQARDGREWTYCHLSYLDPAVQPNAVLAAGTPVGFVGATGEATGPHLHLQLQPAESYPQEEEWFASFAGVAFRWQDEPAPDASGGAVFAVVPPPNEG